MSQISISTKNVSKSFQVGEQLVPVLKDIDFDVKKGEFLVIFGPSGCGKSTLLHILLGLEPPTKGEVKVLGQNLYSLDQDEMALFRKEHMGMVYQQPRWIKSLTVMENLAFPLTMVRTSDDIIQKKVQDMLKMLQMEKWANYWPSELSSGQQQRIALARALISNPEIIIADEPTGNLDFDSGSELMSLLKKVNKEADKTVIMVTHDLDYMQYADNSIQMLDGKLIEKFDRAGTQNLLKTMHSKRGLSYEE